MPKERGKTLTRSLSVPAGARNAPGEDAEQHKNPLPGIRPTLGAELLEIAASIMDFQGRFRVLDARWVALALRRGESPRRR